MKGKPPDNSQYNLYRQRLENIINPTPCANWKKAFPQLYGVISPGARTEMSSVFGTGQVIESEATIA